MSATDAFALLEIIGTVAFAASGGAVAIRAGMDWLGVIVLAVVTAVGGGTIRDILLGHVPVSWMVHPWPIAVAIATGIVTIIIGSKLPHLSIDTLSPMLIADAIGLAAFTVSGTQASLDASQAAVIAVILGVLTGAGGGVLRDLLAGQRPLILVGQIYAVAALAGASIIVAFAAAGVPEVLARWIAVAVILGIRLAAIKWNWALPVFAPAHLRSTGPRSPDSRTRGLPQSRTGESPDAYPEERSGG